MISATLLALLTVAAPPSAPSARVFLKAPAATAPACRATRSDGGLLQVALFSPEGDECPVANVADEVIVLRELAEALEFGHMQKPLRTGAKGTRPDMDFTPALDRLIATRLLVLEAREMRLDQDRDFVATIEGYKASRLRAALQRSAAKDVKPDPAEVEKLYRNAVREWKLKSVLVEKEDAAKAFEAALKGGAGFDATAKKFVADNRAKGGGPAEFVGPKHMLPEIRAAVEKAKPGVAVGPVKIPAGFVFLRVDGTRYPPNDKAAREEARARSLARMEHETIRRFYLSLVEKYAKVDRALLKQLDFEKGGEKGFEELLKDQRVLVAIKGDKPVTVGDLTKEVSMKFFHGIKSPIQEKRVNTTKDDTFERLLGARLFAKEASVRKLDQRPEFVREVDEYERALIFNVFVEKVIAPDVKVTEQDAMRYYEEHKAEFTSPQMFKLDGFAFQSAKEAQAALEKLKGGTDFNWLRSQAPGQLPPEKRSLQFEGATLSVNALPPALAKALTGVRTGEYRLFAAKDSEVYVVKVVEQTAPAPQPYVEARENIAKKLFNEKLTAAIGDYAGKLRKAQPVDVIIARVSL